jgi:hypothetical protein
MNTLCIRLLFAAPLEWQSCGREPLYYQGNVCSVPQLKAYLSWKSRSSVNLSLIPIVNVGPSNQTTIAQ